MMADFHFLRPLWLLAVIPLCILAYQLLLQKRSLSAWDKVCDEHLLKHLSQQTSKSFFPIDSVLLILSLLFLIISLAGPTWKRLPVPYFKPISPRVIVLSLSDNMLNEDISPNRLNRAKFILRDLLKQNNKGQWGMIVYTGEAFVVSPLTEDSNTISSLLSVLKPNIMPLSGHNLGPALEEAKKLINQAGFNQGQILVLTASAPSAKAIETAVSLRKQDFDTSVLPMNGNKEFSNLYRKLVSKGGGELLSINDVSSDLNAWLKKSKVHNLFAQSQMNHIPIWRDEGRWFLLPALLFLLPVFRRGWLQGVSL